MTTDIVIPTYNRWASLAGTIASLSADVGDAQGIRILVVDDGSTDPRPAPLAAGRSIPLEVVTQANQGDAIARNTGALASSADNLIFVDDDITVAAGFVRAMADALEVPGLVVVGELQPDTSGPVRWPEGLPRDNDRLRTDLGHRADCEPMPFTGCLSGFMAVRRQDFLNLGMMQPVSARGSSVWCDVDFAYRAHKQGYRFALCRSARGLHHDRARQDLASQRQRSYRVGREAVPLLQRHPELVAYLPMLTDKTPAQPERDGLRMRARKALRRAASSGPAVRALEVLERPSRHVGDSAETAIQRWLIGAELYRGFAEGLDAYGSIAPVPSINR